MFGYANVNTLSPGDTCLADYGRTLPLEGGGSLREHCDFGWAEQCFESADVVTLLDGRPCWPGRSTPVSAADVADAFLRRGTAFLAELNGGFSVVVIDRRSNEIRLAIDRMGVGALSWAADGDAIVFSTAACNLARRPGAAHAVRAQALYDYFYFHMIPSTETVYEGIHKLPAATVLRFARPDVDSNRYWTPAPSPDAAISTDDFSDQLHAGLREAVECRIAAGSTGAFLSGGLDSSTVAGYLSKVSSGSADTFSIGFAAEGYDEIEFARTTNRHFGCRAHEYYVTPEDILSTIPVLVRASSEPFGNSSAVPTYLCARLAREHGMTRLLAGDGGDELFGGNERYARHKVFERFNALPAPFRALATMLTRTISPDSRVLPLRKARSYVDQALIPLPNRFETWNLVYRETPEVMFTEQFMRQIDPSRPLDHMNEVFHAAPSHDLLDRMLYYDWKFTLADNDLRKVGTMCAAAGIEVDYPMLDNRVVDLSMRIPSTTKMQRLELRSFYKRSMRGFLPEQILTKGKHGFGLPFGRWAQTHPELREFVANSMHKLADRGIVKVDFIEKVLENQRRGDAAYYGSTMWDLVILEEWLGVHAGHLTT